VPIELQLTISDQY